jgi:hypothetical protein
MAACHSAEMCQQSLSGHGLRIFKVHGGLRFNDLEISRCPSRAVKRINGSTKCLSLKGIARTGKWEKSFPNFNCISSVSHIQSVSRL